VLTQRIEINVTVDLDNERTGLNGSISKARLLSREGNIDGTTQEVLKIVSLIEHNRIKGNLKERLRELVNIVGDLHKSALDSSAEQKAFLLSLVMARLEDSDSEILATVTNISTSISSRIALTPWTSYTRSYGLQTARIIKRMIDSIQNSSSSNVSEMSELVDNAIATLGKVMAPPISGNESIKIDGFWTKTLAVSLTSSQNRTQLSDGNTSFVIPHSAILFPNGTRQTGLVAIVLTNSRNYWPKPSGEPVTTIRLFQNSLQTGLGEIVVADLSKNESVKLTFQQLQMQKKYECRFFNVSQGNWDTRGCTSMMTQENQLNCYCNHLTSFTAVPVRDTDVPEGVKFNLITFVSLLLLLMFSIVLLAGARRLSAYRKHKTLQCNSDHEIEQFIAQWYHQFVHFALKQFGSATAAEDTSSHAAVDEKKGIQAVDEKKGIQGKGKPHSSQSQIDIEDVVLKTDIERMLNDNLMKGLKHNRSGLDSKGLEDEGKANRRVTELKDNQKKMRHRVITRLKFALFNTRVRSAMEDRQANQSEDLESVNVHPRTGCRTNCEAIRQIWMFKMISHHPYVSIFTSHNEDLYSAEMRVCGLTFTLIMVFCLNGIFYVENPGQNIVGAAISCAIIVTVFDACFTRICKWIGTNTWEVRARELRSLLCRKIVSEHYQLQVSGAVSMRHIDAKYQEAQRERLGERLDTIHAKGLMVSNVARVIFIVFVILCSDIVLGLYLDPDTSVKWLASIIITEIFRAIIGLPLFYLILALIAFSSLQRMPTSSGEYILPPTSMQKTILNVVVANDDLNDLTAYDTFERINAGYTLNMEGLRHLRNFLKCKEEHTESNVHALEVLTLFIRLLKEEGLTAAEVHKTFEDHSVINRSTLVLICVYILIRFFR